MELSRDQAISTLVDNSRREHRKSNILMVSGILCTTLIVMGIGSFVGYRYGVDTTTARNAEIVDRMFAEKIRSYRADHPEGVMEVVLLEQVRDDIYVALR